MAFSKLAELFRKYSNSQAAIAAFWVILSSGGTQAIRLLSNLILTRLLFPEIFGIMALVYAVIIGLNQVSDVGLREGVVNSKRLDEPAFMSTAWTLQLLRTGIIAIGAMALAIPMAHLYDEAILAPVLVMTGISLFLTGFKSIALLSYDKRLDLKIQMIAELAVQVAGLIVVMIWAWFSPTIWALVAGQIFSSALEVILSYTLFKGHHSRLRWDKAAVSELFHFGKWIVISSGISFIIVQGDRLVMGFWLTMGQLGFYSIASNWSALVSLISINLSTRVLHPYFRNSLDATSDFGPIHTTRLRLNFVYLVICVFIAIFGEWIIDILYDDRYISAGWMLQILAVGQIGRAFTGTLRPFLTAQRDSFSQMITSAASAAILVGFILIGGYLSGATGVIIAYAATGIVIHPIMIFFAHKHGYKCLRSDMGLVMLGLAICFLGWWLIDATILDVLTAGMFP